MHPDVDKILLTEQQIAARVEELGKEISADYKGKNPVVLGVLRGSFIFMADLVRQFDFDCTLDFLAVSSYGNGTKTSGSIKISKDANGSMDGRHVLIIEDIVDSGLTLAFLKKLMEAKRVASVKVCTLLDKPERRQVEITPDYLGFTIPDEFAVGYGLDYADHYRTLPYIGVLKPQVYGG